MKTGTIHSPWRYDAGARCARASARQANRPIENTDLVGWYTLGGGLARHAHYVAPLPDSAFNFFAANPALDLPKTQ
jgi:Cu2+-containing amine oxidase